jgi:hypothetical protein
MGYRSLASLVANADDLLKMSMNELAKEVLLTHLKSHGVRRDPGRIVVRRARNETGTQVLEKPLQWFALAFTNDIFKDRRRWSDSP